MRPPLLSVFCASRDGASLIYYTVTAANATGQQCDRVRIARVRPLIPHVFSRPSCFSIHQLPHPTPRTRSDRTAVRIWNWISGKAAVRFFFSVKSRHLLGALPRLARHDLVCKKYGRKIPFQATL